ncbi:hypothetical protein RRG08_028370 [Elysia crispata]|uniref:Uncharacterized protein n=1 Tax=Elysia crispata TaxID=231223 RepID=A0AAE1AXJ8_9GAST|nr:hypothetical protein RRG08_028370 [Elysia crispata]
MTGRAHRLIEHQILVFHPGTSDTPSELVSAARWASLFCSCEHSLVHRSHHRLSQFGGPRDFVIVMSIKGDEDMTYVWPQSLQIPSGFVLRLQTPLQSSAKPCNFQRVDIAICSEYRDSLSSTASRARVGAQFSGPTSTAVVHMFDTVPIRIYCQSHMTVSSYASLAGLTTSLPPSHT